MTSQTSQLISSGEDDEHIIIEGYEKDNFKVIVSNIFYILSLGFLKLMSVWYNSVKLKLTFKTCPLSTASHVWVKNQHKQTYIEEVQVINLNTSQETDAVKIKSTFKKHRFFINKNMKYVWDQETNHFEKLKSIAYKQPCSFFHKCLPLFSQQEHDRRLIYGENGITVEITPILKLLFTEGLNPFYFFQVFSIILWFCDDYYYYACVIFILSVVSLVVQMRQIRMTEIKLKETVGFQQDVFLFRQSDKNAIQVSSRSVVPGDIIDLTSYRGVMGCDVVLLAGSCIVNECMLTGESIPVTKTEIPNTEYSESTSDSIFSLKDHSRHVIFSGTKVIQCRFYQGQAVKAVVLTTGFMTSKGQLIRSIMHPKPLSINFKEDSYKFMACLAIVSLTGMIYTLVIMIMRKQKAGTIVLRTLDLITIAVPPALPAALTVAVVMAQNRLWKASIFCISPRNINSCGTLDTFCFDKTGTLTEEGLDLEMVVPCREKKFQNAVCEISSLGNDNKMLLAMATCHSLTIVDGVLVGDPLELKMFEATDWNLEEPGVNFNKDDSFAPTIVKPKLVYNKNKNKYSYDQSNDIYQQTYDNDMPKDSQEKESIPSSPEYGIMKQFVFSSKLQRMSVVVKRLEETHFKLFCKGAPEMILSLSLPQTVPQDFQKILFHYTRQGFRVLAVAWKQLKMKIVEVETAQRNTLENNLKFLGFIVFANQLKTQTTEVIEILNKANIRTIMVTGDNLLTALSVAKNCKMIGEKEQTVFITSLNNEIKRKKNIVQNCNTELSNINTLKTNGNKDEQFFTNEAFDESDSNYKNGFEIHWALVDGSDDGGSNTRCGNNVNVADVGEENIKICDNNVNGIKNDTDCKDKGFCQIQISLLPLHMALTGNSWLLLRKHHPYMLNKILKHGMVFARFSPDQKQQLVEALIEKGYYVGMCGDGANDCGALKAAHAGVSLSEAEASVASPFTSKKADIECAVTLIREGRAALVTSFGIFKYMAAYSITQFMSVCILYWVRANFTNSFFIYIDICLLTLLGFTFTRTAAYSHLHHHPPNQRLFSPSPILSLVFQTIINFFFQFSTWWFITTQPWFMPYIPNKKDTYASQEVTVIFSISAFQYITLAIIFSKGKPFRKSIFSNYIFLASIIFLIVLTSLIVLQPFQAHWFTHFFKIVPAPSLAFRYYILGWALVNFIISYLVEAFLIDYFAERRFYKDSRNKLKEPRDSSKFEKNPLIIQDNENDPNKISSKNGTLLGSLEGPSSYFTFKKSDDYIQSNENVLETKTQKIDNHLENKTISFCKDSEDVEILESFPIKKCNQPTYQPINHKKSTNQLFKTSLQSLLPSNNQHSSLTQLLEAETSCSDWMKSAAKSCNGGNSDVEDYNDHSDDDDTVMTF